MPAKRSLIPVLLAIFASTVVGCPDGFLPWHEGYCYSVSLGAAESWRHAVGYCRDAGGELASIHSAFENTRIRAAMATTGQDEVWTGLQCIGVPTWLDRTPVTFINGHSYDACNTEVNIAFSIAADEWGEYPIEDRAFYGLCRHRRRNGERCSDYDEVDGTGACVSIRTDPQTWWIAEDKCLQEGGHLLSIHDQKMNEHVRKRISNPELVGDSSLFLIGMQTQATPKGETYNWSDSSIVNYTNFDTGMPTDFLGQCTAMQTIPGGKWMSTNCDHSKLPYICSRPVNDPIQDAVCHGNPNFKDSGTIMSPSYPASSGPLSGCDYVLTVAQGMKVQLVINDFNTNLCCDKLYLFDGLTTTTPFAALSGKAPQTVYTTPTGNVLRMTYNSTDGTFVRGWKVTFNGVRS